MLFVLLKGGLGNQLFQYQFGEMLSKKYNDEVQFCIEENRCGNCLSKVGINVNIVKSKKMNFFSSKKNVLIKGIKILFPRLTYQILKLFGVYYWDSPAYKNVELNKNKKKKYIIGYWQFNSLFENNSIKLELGDEILNKVSSYAEKLDDNSCFVHVRRGDYVNHKYLYVCDKDYYVNAMNKMYEINNKTKFYIISNDIEWCKNNIDWKDCVYVEDLNNDISEFYLMSLFKNAIISNSTFSYCSLNVGEYPKNVIAPKIWRKGKRAKYKDIYDKRWTLV